MTIALPSAVSAALQKLNNAGYEAYVVGGCVRDSLLGIQPNDWDITTNALPDEITAVFVGERVIPTGIAHGTVTVLLDGQPLEITTYRVDGTYSDNRHPDSVVFTRSLKDDLARRDFTVNALAYHPTVGLVDCFSGLADLARGAIVCVGEPEKRFTEDALRILRALRFSAQLGFTIEKMTAAAIRKLAPLLQRVSAERIAAELGKLLCGKAVKGVLNAYPDVFGIILPELVPSVGLRQENPYHYLTVYEHTVETVAAIPPELPLRLAMLFHDCGKPQCHTRDANGVDHFRGHPPISAAMAEQALERLRFDRRTIDTVKMLVLHHDDRLDQTDLTLKHLLSEYGLDNALSLIAVQRADILGQHPDKRDRLTELDAMEQRLHELVAENACVSLKQLAVNGEDLLALGFAPGRAIGDTLHSLLDGVMSDEYPNERTALLNAARKYRQ